MVERTSRRVTGTPTAQWRRSRSTTAASGPSRLTIPDTCPEVTMSSQRGVLLAAARPPWFWGSSSGLTRSGQFPVAKVAPQLGISALCLGRWMAQETSTRAREGRSIDERGIGRAAPAEPGARGGERVLKRASAYFARENPPFRGDRPARREVGGRRVSVALTCRVLGIARSGLYEALTRAPSACQVAD